MSRTQIGSPLNATESPNGLHTDVRSTGAITRAQPRLARTAANFISVGLDGKTPAMPPGLAK